jgi:HrpA-like RNA helicase
VGRRHRWHTTKRKIGCSQPRRVAATSVAQRVAEEVGCRCGKKLDTKSGLRIGRARRP